MENSGRNIINKIGFPEIEPETSGSFVILFAFINFVMMTVRMKSTGDDLSFYLWPIFFCVYTYFDSIMTRSLCLYLYLSHSHAFDE